MNNSMEAYKGGLEIYFHSIILFGILVKTILAYIFPEIILDKEGIKFIGREKLKWSAAKSIKISQGNNEMSIIFEKYNSKKII